ncbi:MAG: nucleotidyl transferase AbiEii/AbiGii toxin family protein [Acidobacteria bacterium]|nr:nucleotidyl transferase AbiEii/AbiGii toxin family protein [Acidobacteriota bacterium]
MLDFARLALEERIPYFQEVANRRGLTRLIVEKDFWVCFVLRLLFSTPVLADKFVFKGGTSLSKVFGIIKRFSEDIDLSVDPEWLGFGGDGRPDAAPSRSQFEKRLKKLNDACATAVEERVQPEPDNGQ